MTNITKEGVEVKPGQIWRDLDRRCGGRLVKVLDVSDGRVSVRPCTPNGNEVLSMRKTKLSISRMHRGSTGWQLARNV